MHHILCAALSTGIAEPDRPPTCQSIEASITSKGDDVLLGIGCGGCRLANPERIGISLGFLKGGEDIIGRIIAQVARTSQPSTCGQITRPVTASTERTLHFFMLGRQWSCSQTLGRAPRPTRPRDSSSICLVSLLSSACSANVADTAWMQGMMSMRRFSRRPSS